MIRWLKEIGKEDFAWVGGKGFNLARMWQAGIPVPDGFVVLTSAYESYVEENGLKLRMEELQASELSTAEKSELIRSLFDVAKVPEELSAAILEAFAKIGSGRVAVRSSSTVEDLAGMSFAGQYTSYLNVTEDDLMEKVLACWRSLWNERAMGYRRKNRIPSDFSHAVVIQEMVESAISGVVFTANPLNGLRDQMVINASFGLGEAIVSGEVNPDQLVWDRKSEGVLTKSISNKTVKYIYGGSGIKKVQVGEDQAKIPCMEDSQIVQLAKEAAKAEAYFGKPQDLEFAFDPFGRLFLLQSRDITTLYPVDNLVHDGKLRAYMSAGTVLLGVREPFTPLGYDLMSKMFPTIINVMTARKKRPLTNSFVSYAGNRIFVDMTYLLSSGFVAKQFGKSFAGNDLPLQGVMEKMLADYGKILKHQGIHFRPPLGFAKYGLSMSADLRKIMKIPHDQRYKAMIEEGNRWYEKIEKEYQEANTAKQRLDFADHALIQAFRLSQAQALYCLDANNYIKIEKALKKHFGNRYQVETLAQSLPDCVTQTMTIRLNEYAKHCDEAGCAPHVEDPEFQKILADYGHRATIELDFGTKRWREDPTYLLDLASSYMTDQMYLRNLANHREKRQQALDMIEEVTEKMKEKVGRRKADKFRKLMVNYRYGAAMREYPKYDIVRFLDLARQAVQGIGDDLTAAGALEERNDIFFLRREEILTGEGRKGLVARAKAEYEFEMRRTSIPRMILNNGHTYYSAHAIDPKAEVIQGMPLSAGVVEGVVRVVFDPGQVKLREGEILVTESTNPSWTPLFATAGGLIMEYGGPMSHGGIVAREYGIPAVVGIPSASEILRDGQRVRVNGETGIVEIL